MSKIKRTEHKSFEIGKLIPYEKNAKKHPEDQIKHLAKSILDFGFQQPIVADENNVVLLGHGRLLAAKKLNLETVPVWKVEGYTEDQKKTFRIVDNKINLDTGFDVELMQFDLNALESGGIDLKEWKLENFQFQPDAKTDPVKGKDVSNQTMDSKNIIVKYVLKIPQENNDDFEKAFTEFIEKNKFENLTVEKSI